MRKLLYPIGNEAGVLEAGETIGARSDVCLEWCNAKTLLVIEEEVDLGRKKVTMIHEWVYALARKWVSGRRTEFSSKSGLLE